MLKPMNVTPSQRLPLRPSRPPSPRDEQVSAWANQQADSLSQHQSLTVDLGNGAHYTVQGKQVGVVDKTIDGLAEFITAATQEAQSAIIAGPNLALLGVTEVVKPLVLAGAPPGVTSQIDQWYQPGLQAASVGLSLVNFTRRYQEAKTSRTTTLQKALLATNAAHIATSTIGLAGAAGAALVPSLAGYSKAAWGIALAGNVVAFGMNWLDYFDRRSRADMPFTKE